MSDITRGHSFVSGEVVEAQSLNDLVSNAVIQPTFVSEKVLKDPAAMSDRILIEDSGTLKGITIQQIIDLVTPIIVNSAVPIGTVRDFAGGNAPENWMLCYGQLVDRDVFADLFNVLGVTYSAGDGSTTFGIPDYRGCVLAGKVDMGGVGNGLLGNVINGQFINSFAGEERHTMSVGEMPVHGHALSTNMYTSGNENPSVGLPVTASFAGRVIVTAPTSSIQPNPAGGSKCAQQSSTDPDHQQDHQGQKRMTKKELVDLVCVKMHRTDEPTRQEAAAYVRARYRIIYDSRIWNDTIDPPLILNGTLFYNEFGVPITDDEGNILRSGIAGQVIILPFIVGLVISCRWETSAGLLHVEEMAQQFRLHPETFESVGAPIGFSITSPSATTMSPGGGKVSIYSTDTNARYSVSIRGNLGETDQSEVIRASGVSPIYSRYSYDHIGSLGKDDTSFDLVVEDQSGGNLLTLPANESSRLHQRIAFTSTPSNSGALAVLYKRRCRDLVNDSDATEISKIDNMLLAAVETDMRSGERQYGKASLKAQEVQGLMSVAISMEKEQSANNCRIIPELLHSPDWSGKGGD